jgi:hypothetical protein
MNQLESPHDPELDCLPRQMGDVLPL